MAAKLIFSSMLLIVSWLAPCEFARSSPGMERVANHYRFLNSVARPEIVPVVGLPSFRNLEPSAADTRQYAPDYAMSDIGPFFGYFPNMFGFAGEEEEQKPGVINTCGNELGTVLSAAPTGTISLSAAAPAGANDHATCYAGLVASHPHTKVSITCSSIPSDVILTFGDVTPVPDATAGAVQGTTYVSKNSYVVMKVYEKTAQAAFNNVACKWQSVP